MRSSLASIAIELCPTAKLTTSARTSVSCRKGLSMGDLQMRTLRGRGFALGRGRGQGECC